MCTFHHRVAEFYLTSGGVPVTRSSLIIYPNIIRHVETQRVATVLRTIVIHTVHLIVYLRAMVGGQEGCSKAGGVGPLILSVSYRVV